MFVKCDYLHCDNDAEIWSPMGNAICIDCMEREIQEDPENKYEEYESLTEDEKLDI